ncbi:cytochrome c family protein [Candidatus Pelagibacter sp.]|nr:cytochrome c family protein [Candidatus Pelagibacter sp.]
MDSFEINKIIAAIILVVAIIVGLDKVSDGIFHVEKPENPGYKVEVIAKSSTSTSDTTEKIDISALMAMGDVDIGKKVFKKCAACHSIVEGGGNKIGPGLYNVVGRAVGGITDYKYSKSLMSYDKEWTFEELNGFLIKPTSWIKGTKMAFAGLKKEEDRASVIKYMNQNGDSPIPLP